jgi:hypothetical protein
MSRKRPSFDHPMPGKTDRVAFRNGSLFTWNDPPHRSTPGASWVLQAIGRSGFRSETGGRLSGTRQPRNPENGMMRYSRVDHRPKRDRVISISAIFLVRKKQRREENCIVQKHPGPD